MKKFFPCFICLMIAACNSQAPETSEPQARPKGAAEQQKIQKQYNDKWKQRYEKSNSNSK